MLVTSLNRDLLSTGHIPGNVLGSRNTRCGGGEPCSRGTSLHCRGKHTQSLQIKLSIYSYAKIITTKVITVSNAQCWQRHDKTATSNTAVYTAKQEATCIEAAQPGPDSFSFIQELQVFSARYGNTLQSLCCSVFLVYSKFYVKEKRSH